MSYRRTGLGFSINPTTIWTPQTGYLATTGTLADGYQYQPQYTSVYDVPGLLLPPPQCALGNPFTAGSSECQSQLMATQQQNFQRSADYNAGFIAHAATAPNEPPPPPAYVQQGSQATPGAPAYVPAVVSAPAPAPAPVVAAANVLTAPGGYIDKAASFLGGETEVAGHEFPVWGLVAAGAAALFFAGRGR